MVVSVFEKALCYEPTYHLTVAQLLECPEFIALIERYTSIFNLKLRDAIIHISLYLTYLSINIEHPSIAKRKQAKHKENGTHLQLLRATRYNTAFPAIKRPETLIVYFSTQQQMQIL